jgi:hypothetical protein
MFSTGAVHCTVDAPVTACTGTAGRGWIYYNTERVGTFRWIFNVRQVTGNHAPTVLIWGTVAPIRDALSAIQFQPPNGGHWDYRQGHDNGGGKEFKFFTHPKWNAKQWAQCEIVASQATGVARMACCPLPTGAATCKATEVLDFTDPTAGRVGPLTIQVHNGGIQDEYRGLYVESPVVTTTVRWADFLRSGPTRSWPAAPQPVPNRTTWVPKYTSKQVNAHSYAAGHCSVECGQ